MNTLTEKDRKDLNLLVRTDELEYKWSEIKPILKELITQAHDLPYSLRNNPKKPTFFPDIIATKPDGSDGTLEELMIAMGYLPLSKPINPPSIKDIAVNLDIKKPAWILWWIWEKTFIKKAINKFLKSYVVVNISDKKI